MTRLDDKATRQEHLSDLMEWLGQQVNVWAREFKMHRSADDKVRLNFYENAVALLKGYLDSFTKDIPTDISEPKVERPRLGDVDTRYNHLVALLELWRDTVELMKEHHSVGSHETEGERFFEYEKYEKIEPELIMKLVPTNDMKQIRLFEKTIEIVEIYQEALTGEFAYNGVSKTYPSFKDGAIRILKPTCDEAYKIGVAANKKRVLDAADKKIASEKKAEGTEDEGQAPVATKNEEFTNNSQPAQRGDERGEGHSDEDDGFSSVT